MAENPQSPQLEISRTDIPSEGEVTGNETATEKEAPGTPKIPLKAVTKEESVSQRRSIGNKRPISSTTSAMKTTASTTARAGGTTKQPVKTPQVSATRKSISTTSNQTSGHIRSQNSIGGSGDEKRKMLASTARRASITPSVSNHTPARVETLAEKRGMPTTTGRRPTNSADSASLKSSAKPNIAPTKPASSIKAKPITTSKQSTPSAISDAKKKPLTSSNSTTTTKPSARNSTSSVKEIDDLKVKLIERDVQIEGLKSEVSAAEKKIQELDRDISEKSRKVVEVEEDITTKNNQIIEKIILEHQAEVERLKLDLEKARSDKDNAQESIGKSIEEVQKTKASELAIAVESLRNDHELTLSTFKDELAKSQEDYASLNKTLLEKSAEIETLKSENSLVNDNLQNLKIKHHQDLECLEQTLTERHTAALSVLTTEWETKLNEKDSVHEKIIAELEKNKDTIIGELQSRLEDSVASLASQSQVFDEKIKNLNQENEGLRDSAIKFTAESESQIAALKEEIRALKENYETIQKQARDEKNRAAEEMNNLSTKLKESTTDLAIMSDENTQVKAELLVTKKMMKSFEEDDKSKDDQHSKTQADLETITKKLREKKDEIVLLQQTYENERQLTITNIENLRKESSTTREEFESLKLDHDELLKKYQETSGNHATELNIVRHELTSMKDGYEKEIEDLKATHEKKLEDSRNQAIDAKSKAHESELIILQEKHEEIVSKLQQDCATNESKALSLSEELQNLDRDLKSKLVESQSTIANIKNDLENARQELVHEKMAKALAQSELDAALNKKPDTTEVDNLKQRLQALQDQRQKETEVNNRDHLAAKNSLEKLIRKKEKSLSKHVEKNEVLTKAIERANTKISDSEQRLKEAEAQLKVKDAELSEVKVKLASLTQNHSKASLNSDGNLAEVVETQDESGSSAALATLAHAKVSARHVVQMNEELRNNNLRSLQSITDV
ncbi:hypothetical protein K3495_g7907 [Podosphaera aphanis]|nr:hypothetical protein K3495_g7907 [Podosphaera aphanis]